MRVPGKAAVTMTEDWKRCRSAEWTVTQTERRRKSPSDSLSWGTPDLELLIPPARRKEGWRARVGEPLSSALALLFLLSELHRGSCKKNAEPAPREADISDGFYPLEGRLSPSFPPGNPVTISVVPMLQKSRDGLVKVSRKVFSLNPL